MSRICGQPPLQELRVELTSASDANRLGNEVLLRAFTKKRSLIAPCETLSGQQSRATHRLLTYRTVSYEIDIVLKSQSLW